MKAAREQLRNKVQTTLLDGVTAYMNVLLTSRVLELRQSNVAFLQEQVCAANDRFLGGRGHPHRCVAGGSRACRCHGVGQRLAGRPADRQGQLHPDHRPRAQGACFSGPDHQLLPSKMSVAVEASCREHPFILAALYNTETATFNVAIQEGALLPSLGIQGKTGSTLASQSETTGATAVDRARTFDGSIGLQLTIPIYQGGSEYSAVRRRKNSSARRSFRPTRRVPASMPRSRRPGVVLSRPRRRLSPPRPPSRLASWRLMA